MTSRAGVGAVVARLTGLIGAHGPSSVLFTGSDGDQTGIGRELALSTLLLESSALRDGAGFMVARMEMTVVRGLHARNERDERSGSGGRNVELHIGRKRKVKSECIESNQQKTNDWATMAGIGGTQISQSRSTEQKRRGKRDTKGLSRRPVRTEPDQGKMGSTQGP